MDRNYFGKPYIGLIEYFRKAKKGTLVDLGAGQGRDSISLVQMGYDVTAVDTSSVGLKQMIEIQPNIKAIFCDLYCFDVSSFDYILMDSIVHFYKSDLERETVLIKRIISEMKQNAIFVNCLLKSKKPKRYLRPLYRYLM